jgi:hypothetical protein
VKGASADNRSVAVFGWICFVIVAVVLAAVMVGLFVEERALEIPRLYEDDALR